MGVYWTCRKYVGWWHIWANQRTLLEASEVIQSCYFILSCLVKLSPRRPAALNIGDRRILQPVDVDDCGQRGLECNSSQVVPQHWARRVTRSNRSKATALPTLAESARRSADLDDARLPAMDRNAESFSLLAARCHYHCLLAWSKYGKDCFHGPQISLSSALF